MIRHRRLSLDLDDSYPLMVHLPSTSPEPGLVQLRLLTNHLRNSFSSPRPYYHLFTHQISPMLWEGIKCIIAS